MFAMLNCLYQPPFALSLSISFSFFMNVKALFCFVFLQSVPTTANLVLLYIRSMGYNNLIRHSKNVDIKL